MPRKRTQFVVRDAETCAVLDANARVSPDLRKASRAFPGERVRAVKLSSGLWVLGFTYIGGKIREESDAKFVTIEE